MTVFLELWCGFTVAPDWGGYPLVFMLVLSILVIVQYHADVGLKTPELLLFAVTFMFKAEVRFGFFGSAVSWYRGQGHCPLNDGFVCVAQIHILCSSLFSLIVVFINSFSGEERVCKTSDRFCPVEFGSSCLIGVNGWDPMTMLLHASSFPRFGVDEFS